MHVVDLEGARKGEFVNFSTIQKITSAVNIPVQAGGGIRSLEEAVKLFSYGVTRLIVSTMVLENQPLLSNLIERLTGRIDVSLDARKELLLMKGWLRKSEKTIFEIVKNLASLGVSRFIYTDTTRDGTMTAPNYPIIKKLLTVTNVPLIVSGGISRLSQIKKLSKFGVEGVIIGKALYEGSFSLKEVNDVS